MFDNIDFKGHFTIQAIDKDGCVIDQWEDDNMIMADARITMSELFSNLNTSTFINKITIGTMGHVGDSILIPKGKDDGFVKERARLFSTATSTANNVVLDIVRKNDIFLVDPYGIATYYRYIGSDVESYSINDTVLSDTELWENLGTTEPYTYSINFTISGDNSNPDGNIADAISESDPGSGSEVKVLQKDTSVTFTADFATAAANEQNENTSVFTEAALYANDRIFAMKTFKAKVKDSTVLLRIIWTITF